MKQTLANHIKNTIGWRTRRKLVVISVDDYGNVRLDSKDARRKMDKAGLKIHSRFDAFDTLENREDLEALFEVLSSVKDKNDNPAVFTPFAMPCNIDFEAMKEDGYQKYIYEPLPETYSKLSLKDPKAYEGAWELWNEGIEKGLMKPQFHGREHLNLEVLEMKLKNKDKEVLSALDNRSYTSLSSSGFDNISFTAAFEFENKNRNDFFESIIEDGLNKFEQVYGYRSTHFNPPGGREHPIIHEFLAKNGIKYLDTPFLKSEHQGKGKYRKILNWTGKKTHYDQIYQVRNVVFEPTQERGIDWVDYSFKQVEAAFYWNKPAIISSHRVNFCGHIDPKNRKKGLNELKILLKRIVSKFPDVEFISSEELGQIIKSSNKLR